MHIVEAAPLAPAAATGFDLPYSDFGRRYYPEALSGQHNDLSFSVCGANGLILTVWCGVLASKLGYFGFPALVQFNPAAFTAERQSAMRLALKELSRRAHAAGAREIELAIDPVNDPQGFATTALTSADVMHKARVIAEVSLYQTGLEIEAGMRKGHRQQVRWGQSHMTYRTIDAANPDFASFDLLRLLHAEVAGRVTRPAASWNTTFDAIRTGLGSAVLGYLEGILVSGSIVIDSGGSSYYATGVYDRKHFDKPLSHTAIFLSMLAAKARGSAKFVLGDIPLKGTVSDKEFQIGWFKRGFSAQSSIQTSFTFTLAAGVNQAAVPHP